MTASAGVGVAEKSARYHADLLSIYAVHLCFCGSELRRGTDGPCKKALHYGVAVSFAIGVGMFFLSFFHGGALAGIFSSDTMVIDVAADYLKAYAIDCMLYLKKKQRV